MESSTSSMLYRPRKSLLSKIRFLRYRWFGRGPTPAEWEERVRRGVAATVETALPWVPTGGVFLDVGANIGMFSEEILRQRPDARAFLFEPVREHYDRCCARFRCNPRVVVEHFALGDRAGRATIWKAKHNPGGNVIDVRIVEPRRWHIDFRSEEIEIRVFEEYAREKGIERVDFVKTDTEGYDYRVLSGTLGFLRAQRNKPAILAELWREDVHPDYAAQVKVIEQLYDLGYGRVDLTGMREVQDFLFVCASSESPSGQVS